MTFITESANDDATTAAQDSEHAADLADANITDGVNPRSASLEHDRLRSRGQRVAAGALQSADDRAPTMSPQEFAREYDRLRSCGQKDAASRLRERYLTAAAGGGASSHDLTRPGGGR